MSVASGETALSSCAVVCKVEGVPVRRVLRILSQCVAVLVGRAVRVGVCLVTRSICSCCARFACKTISTSSQRRYFSPSRDEMRKTFAPRAYGAQTLWRPLQAIIWRGPAPVWRRCTSCTAAPCWLWPRCPGPPMVAGPRSLLGARTRTATFGTVRGGPPHGGETPSCQHKWRRVVRTRSKPRTKVGRLCPKKPAMGSLSFPACASAYRCRESVTKRVYCPQACPPVPRRAAAAVGRRARARGVDSTLLLPMAAGSPSPPPPPPPPRPPPPPPPCRRERGADR